MSKIKIERLVWDEWNKEHIKKHQVTQQEIEEAILKIVAHRKGYSGRTILIGRSGKRIVSIIVSKERRNAYYVVTARDADKKERRLVYKYEKERKQDS